LNGAWVLESKNLLNPLRQDLPAGFKSVATLELWDWSTLTARKVSLSHLPVGKCMAAAFSPKGDYVAFNLPSSGQGGKAREIVLVDVATGEARPQTFLTDGPGEGLLEFSPDGQRLFINGGNRDWIWDWKTTNAPFALPALHPGIRRFAHARDASRLAICQYPEGVTVWDSSSPSLIETLPRSFTDSWYLSFSADGNTLAVGHGLGGNSKFWHVPTHRELLAFPNGRAVCFSPNEEVLAVVAIEGVYFTSLPTLAEIDASLTSDPANLLSIALKETEAIRTSQ
jgi:WD40 repeat protein